MKSNSISGMSSRSNRNARKLENLGSETEGTLTVQNETIMNSEYESEYEPKGNCLPGIIPVVQLEDMDTLD